MQLTDAGQLSSGTSFCARVLGGLNGIGAAFAVGWLSAGQGHGLRGAGLAACAVLAGGIVIATVKWPHRFGLRAIEAALAFTVVVLTSGAMISAGAAGEVFKAFYIVAAVYAFAFLPPARALTVGALIATAYGVVLVSVHHVGGAGSDVNRWVMLVALELCCGGLIWGLGEGLRRGERRFRNGLEASSIGAALLDPSGRIAYANPALQALLGSEAVSLEEHLLAEGRRRLRQALEHVRGGQEASVTFETELVGSRAVTISVSQLPEREPLHTLVQVDDITERVRMQRAVAESERAYRLMFERNPQPMWVYDRQTLRFLAVNACAIAHYGYTREEFLAMTIEDIRPPDDVARLRRSLAAADGARAEGEVWSHVKKDGQVIDVEVLAEPFELEGRDARLVVATDITARVEAARRLRYQADHDPLTGLLNRKRLEQEIGWLVNTGDCALVLFDIDHFKLVNDSLGHVRGDRLLKAVADTMSAELQDGQQLGRLGGDEFALLVGGAGESEAREIATHLLTRIREQVSEGNRSITASAGIATSTRGQRVSATELLMAADIALYEAKGAGRARFAVAARTGRGHTWVDEIHAALEEDRFVLHAQPIIDLTTGETVREELLVRMVDRSEELILPGSFIPAAEGFGLIGEIDRWVVARALELAAEGRRLEINLSAYSLGDWEITRMVADAVAKGIDPANLVFEITETAAAANYRQAAEFAERLSRIGCGFALDDFGTGFGSLSYLKHIAFSYLKIDIDFVRELSRHRDSQRIVRAIVTIASHLGQKTIAEGVEDASALSILGGLGVDHAQGYHIGRPQPIQVAGGLQEAA